MAATSEEHGAPIDDCPWLVQSGFFRRVVRYDHAAELLNDSRLHADMVGLFEGVGIRSGPLWEVMQSSFLSINGAEHKRVRGLVAGDFTPRAVESVRATARDHADQLARDFAESGGGDLVAEFAKPYVAAVTCGYIGFPESDIAEVVDAVDLLSFATRDLGGRVDECTTSVLQLMSCARSGLQFRRDRPAGDVLSHIAALVDSEQLPEMTALGLVAGLLSAGFEPSVNQLGLMVMTLVEQPTTWDGLARGQRNLARTVEESLRFRSTNRGFNRLVSEPVEYAGQTLKQGEQLLLGLDEINHDPTRFPHPWEFDPDANARPHMAFGFGAHFCLGAALARVQLQEALGALTTAVTCPTVKHAEVHDGAGLTGPLVLDLACEAREVRRLS